MAVSMVMARPLPETPALGDSRSRRIADDAARHRSNRAADQSAGHGSQRAIPQPFLRIGENGRANKSGDHDKGQKRLVQ